MDGRYNPYQSPGRQRQQQALQEALEMQEALHMQRQYELQRDIQIRQLLLQDQIDQQLLQAPSMLHQQRMYELQNYGHPLAALQEEQLLIQQQEQMRREQQLQQQLQLSAALNSPSRRDLAAEALVADSLSHATGRPSPQRKRSLSRDEGSPAASGRRGPRTKKEKASVALLEMDDMEVSPIKKKARGKTTKKSAASAKGSQKDKKMPARRSPSAKVEDQGVDIEDAIDLLGAVRRGHSSQKGSVEALVAAADAEQQVGDAATLMVGLQNVEWSDSESEDAVPAERIQLPGFDSKLPRLPEEPEYDSSLDAMIARRARMNSEKGREATANGTSPSQQAKGANAKDSSSLHQKPKAVPEYPFPIDTWWPSNTTIRRERRIHGEVSDEEDHADEPILSNEEESLFRGEMTAIRKRLANDVEPGVLEKIPHCKLHQMRTKNQKGGTKPEPVFCWQVTENYCNEVMLCCSVCSTWRHAYCGGHYKPLTSRSIINSNTPFTPICDRCYEEKKLLQDYPTAQTRIDRQRTEQLRRALETSAVIRQASFAKHGGTYKWPLGSVSATHIGGHTRSVHSRHDKAEKQWSELSVRLGRGLGYRPKERVKVRTKELERLLVSVEDAEGIMDRHNMILFLQQDTRREHPVGFDRPRRNLCDPEDDANGEQAESTDEEESETAKDVAKDKEIESEDADNGAVTKDDVKEGSNGGKDAETGTDDEEENTEKEVGRFTSLRHCAREGCRAKPRFDSMFCSDSCGVSALELDLLRSLEHAGDIHPSLLRS